MRLCQICHGEIPSSAHRLQKLCGKKECSLTQARMSSRKSYHKLLGHTVAQKRSCVVCGADITGTRTNRVVCFDPKCKEQIKRRSKEDYYARTKNDPAIIAKKRINATNYRSKHRKVRQCIVCHQGIYGQPARSVVCGNPECTSKLNRLRAERGIQKSPMKRIRTIARTTVRPEPKTKVVSAQNNPIKLHQPKKLVRKRIREDTTPWVPKPLNIPDFTPSNKPVAAVSVHDAFENRWDCFACSQQNDLCALHQRMENDGAKPPANIKAPIIRRIVS